MTRFASGYTKLFFCTKESVIFSLLLLTLVLIGSDNWVWKCWDYEKKSFTIYNIYHIRLFWRWSAKWYANKLQMFSICWFSWFGKRSRHCSTFLTNFPCLMEVKARRGFLWLKKSFFWYTEYRTLIGRCLSFFMYLTISRLLPYFCFF